MTWIVAAVVMIAACSSGTRPPPGPHVPVARADAGQIAAPGPSERECADLVAHAIALGVADQRAAKPDQVATDEEQAKIHGELGELERECRSLDREVYRCAIAAPTTAALVACQPR